MTSERTLAASERDARIRWTVQHTAHGSSWYAARLAAAGVEPGDVRAVDDLPVLPFTTKEHLRSTYPYGWTAVPLDDVVRVHASSGTTGRRTVATHTAQDIENWTTIFARCYAYTGVTRHDRVQVTPGYGLWTAGVIFQAGPSATGRWSSPWGPPATWTCTSK